MHEKLRALQSAFKQCVGKWSMHSACHEPSSGVLDSAALQHRSIYPMSRIVSVGYKASNPAMHGL